MWNHTTVTLKNCWIGDPWWEISRHGALNLKKKKKKKKHTWVMASNQVARGSNDSLTHLCPKHMGNSSFYKWHSTPCQGYNNFRLYPPFQTGPSLMTREAKHSYEIVCKTAFFCPFSEDDKEPNVSHEWMKSCSGSNISLDWLTWVFSTLEIIWPSTHQCNHPLDQPLNHP
jgi:hypothetical protein